MEGVYVFDGDAGECEVIADCDPAVGFTKTTYEPTSGIYAGRQARAMLVQVLTNSVNVTKNGTTPTATAGTNKGLTYAAGTSFWVIGINNIRNFKAIDAVSGSAGVVKGEPYF